MADLLDPLGKAKLLNKEFNIGGFLPSFILFEDQNVDSTSKVRTSVRRLIDFALME